jgi:hypothetical protein
MAPTSTSTILNGNTPVWAKALLAIGVVPGIAIYLVWLLGGSVQGAIAQHDATMRELVRVLVSVSQQICVNTATSDAERASCWAAPR